MTTSTYSITITYWTSPNIPTEYATVEEELESNRSNFQFANDILDRTYSELGISVPAHLQEEYAGRFKVFKSDPLFNKAFKKIEIPRLEKYGKVAFNYHSKNP